MGVVRRRTTGTEIGSPARTALGGRGAGGDMAMQTLRLVQRRQGSTVHLAPTGIDASMSMSGSAHGNGTGNSAILLTHDDASYSPWTVEDGGLALAPPKTGLFNLKLTVTVEFTLIPDHEYGSPYFWIEVPWGTGTAGESFFSPDKFIYNDEGGSSSFSGDVVRSPDADSFWHTIQVTMRNINPFPLSTDPEGPPVADGVTWTATSQFQYIDRLVDTG